MKEKSQRFSESFCANDEEKCQVMHILLIFARIFFYLSCFMLCHCGVMHKQILFFMYKNNKRISHSTKYFSLHFKENVFFKWERNISILSNEIEIVLFSVSNCSFLFNVQQSFIVISKTSEVFLYENIALF